MVNNLRDVLSRRVMSEDDRNIFVELFLFACDNGSSENKENDKEKIKENDKSKYKTVDSSLLEYDYHTPELNLKGNYTEGEIVQIGTTLYKISTDTYGNAKALKSSAILMNVVVDSSSTPAFKYDEATKKLYITNSYYNSNPDSVIENIDDPIGLLLKSNNGNYYIIIINENHNNHDISNAPGKSLSFVTNSYSDKITIDE